MKMLIVLSTEIVVLILYFVLGAKTFKPQYVYKQSEQDFLDNQKKHQEEILKQSIEYGPLGVKLWFTGDSKNKDVTCTEPNRPPPDTNLYCPPSDDDRLECVAKGQFSWFW